MAPPELVASTVEAKLRSLFNRAFTKDQYDSFLRCMNESTRWPSGFRLAETPVFLTPEFAHEVVRAARDIVAQTRTSAFAEHAASAIPPGLEVPRESPHPDFLIVDLAICAEGGRLVPRLIELQAFPSLFGFQFLLLGCLRKSFPVIPENWTSTFSGLRDQEYLALLRRTIVDEADPENVVLLEIEPDQQKTRIDFACTDSLLGTRVVSLTEVKKQGRQLYYQRDGREVRIERIYNRVIFDELERRPELRPAFRFQEDLDVTWVTHPNWYYRISKHSLPFLRTEHTAPAFFADNFPKGESLSDYVLKPLYSFAGLGVEMEPTEEKVAALDKPQHWILQKKVEYAAFLQTPHGVHSKAELRMMFVWPQSDPDPTLVNNLVRLSQGRMMGVDFNREKTWVGSNIALYAR